METWRGAEFRYLRPSGSRITEHKHLQLGYSLHVVGIIIISFCNKKVFASRAADSFVLFSILKILAACWVLLADGREEGVTMYSYSDHS